MADWAKEQIKRQLSGSSFPKKQGKFQTQKVKIDGYEFPYYESVIYQELKVDPNLDVLKVRPGFELFPGFDRGKHKIRAIRYTADFLVYDKAEKRLEIWEIKSKGTAGMTDYQIRKKLFLMRFMDVFFREITFDKGKRTEKIYCP